MSILLTLLDLPSAISSPVSADGLSPFASPDGPTIAPSGPARRPASRGATQGSARGTTTSGTLPPPSSPSSPHAALPTSTENRSQARQCSDALQAAINAALSESAHGSTIYSLASKMQVTPAGRAIFRLRASGRRTSDSGAGSWPAGGPPPMAQTGPQNGNNAAGDSDSSRKTVELAGWTSPQAHDTSGRSKGQKDIHGAKHGCACLVRDAEMARWSTPTAQDSARGNGTTRPHDTGFPLPQQAPWTGPARITADGRILTGSCAGMESGGQLNPRFSGWLMGYPTSWCVAALSCPLPHRSRGGKRAPKEQRPALGARSGSKATATRSSPSLPPSGFGSPKHWFLEMVFESALS